MKNSKFKVAHILLIAFLFCIFGCSQSSNQKNDNVKNINNTNSAGSETDQEHKRGDTGWPYVAGYSPLTFEKYTSIREDSDSFSLVAISYRKESNFDDGIPLDIIWLGLNGGFAGKSFIFSSISEYPSSLYQDIEGVTPPNGETLYTTFTPSQVEAVYNYIESAENRGYFFDGSEYNGLETPYDSEGECVVEANYMLCLSFTEPDEMYYEWAIHKGEDEPCDILQGLIDILEDDFISQF